MRCNAMQCNSMQWHNKKKEKKSCKMSQDNTNQKKKLNHKNHNTCKMFVAVVNESVDSSQMNWCKCKQLSNFVAFVCVWLMLFSCNLHANALSTAKQHQRKCKPNAVCLFGWLSLFCKPHCIHIEWCCRDTELYVHLVCASSEFRWAQRIHIHWNQSTCVSKLFCSSTCTYN